MLMKRADNDADNDDLAWDDDGSGTVLFRVAATVDIQDVQVRKEKGKAKVLKCKTYSITV